MTLYPQQRQALDWIHDFLKGDDVEATLTGYAGTGKTFLLKALVGELKIPFCITAPVHKAVRVIEEVVNRKGKTFHSLHGLRPNVDLASFDLDNLRFDTLGEPQVKYFKLIICDECSQISDNLYKLNKDRAAMFGYKVLYIGDEAQLPPIRKYAKDEGKQSLTFDVINKFRLTEIVRQEEGNPLLHPFNLLRGDIEHKTSNFTKYIFENRDTITNGSGYKLLNEINFKPILGEIYTSDAFRSNPNYSRHICYTNTSVSMWNKIIREFLFKQKSSTVLLPGDVLMAYNTTVDEFNEAIFINSETYLVENIRDYVNDYGIKLFTVNLIDKGTSLPTRTLQIVDHKDASFLRYRKILSELHIRAKNANQGERVAKWKKYYAFKDELLCLVSFELPEINNKQIVKKDFDYGYAITAHKAQGSTFDIGTMDLADMLYYTDVNGKRRPRYNKDLVNKLIYVGMTRVKNKMYIHI